MRTLLLVVVVLVLALVALTYGLYGDRGSDAADSKQRAGGAQVDVRAPPGEVGQTIEGRVLDASGVPVPGARVHLTTGSQARLTTQRCAEDGALLLVCDAPESAERVAKLLEQEPGGLEPAMSTVAGEDGRFRFMGLAGSSFTVWSQSSTHGAASHERAAPGVPVELRLPPPRSISGTVMGERGRPELGATVWAVSRKSSIVVKAQTGAGGRFALSGLGEGPFYVVASAEGYLATGVNSPELDGTPLDLQLRRPRELVVTVMKDGRPMDAVVEVKGDHLRHSQKTQRGVARIRTTGREEVAVRAHAGTLTSGLLLVAPGTETVEVTLDLVEGSTVSVTLVDREGQPVVAPRLQVKEAERGRIRVIDDADVGEWQELLSVTAVTGAPVPLGPLVPGDYDLVVEAEGYERGEFPLMVKRGESSLELEMARVPTIAGRVLDEYGRGVANASVLVEPTREHVRSGEDGRFTLQVPNAGGAYTLRAHHSDWGTGEREVSAPAEGVEVSLLPAGVLRVEVTGDGRALEGASVRVGDHFSAGTTGADGVVLLRGLRAGEVEVSVSHPNYAFGDSAKTTVLEDQQQSVQLEMPEHGFLEGEAVDTDGRPIPDVEIHVSDVDRRFKTDSRGRFARIRVLPSEIEEIRVSGRHPAYRQPVMVKKGVPAGQVAHVRLVFEREEGSQPFHGTVVGAGGKPLTRFLVGGREFVDPGGHFELPSAGANQLASLDIPFRADGHREEVRTFPSSQLALGVIELRPLPKVVGRVVDESGSGIEGAWVSVTCDEVQFSALTEPSGRFELTRPCADYPMRFFASKGPQETSLEIEQTAQKTEVVLRAGAVLRGQVFDAVGRPLAGRLLEVSGDFSGPSVVTGRDGRFSVEVSTGRIQMTGFEQGCSHYLRLTQGSSEVVLGRAPGTVALEVNAPPSKGVSVFVMRGDLALEPDPYSMIEKTEWAQSRPLGADGMSVFTGLAPGRYTVVTGVKDFGSPWRSSVRHIGLSRDHAITVELPRPTEP